MTSSDVASLHAGDECPTCGGEIVRYHLRDQGFVPETSWLECINEDWRGECE